MGDALVPAGSPLRQIEIGLAGVADQATELAQHGDTDTLLVWLAQARQLRRILGDLERHIEAEAAGLLPRRSEHPSLGAVEVRKATDRRNWDWPALLDAMWPVLAERSEGDMGAMVTDLLNVVGLTPSKGPRVAQLRELGLDDDEFCTKSPGRITVTIHGKVEQ